MDRLILLVGASGSGKTTIAKELEKEGYNIIHSYTTRKPREENEWGHTFIADWVKNGSFIIHPNGREFYTHKDMIAFKEIYGDYYFATKEQYRGKGISIYVVCPAGAEQVRQNVDDAEVITIFLMADKEIRRKRMIGDKGRKYPLVTDRLRADYKLFSQCKCDYVVDANRELLEVLIDIKEIIEQGEQL